MHDFQEIKNHLTFTHTLSSLSASGEFVNYNGAALQGLGGILMRHGKVVVYAFRQLKR